MTTKPTIDLYQEGIYLLVCIQTPDTVGVEQRWFDNVTEGTRSGEERDLPLYLQAEWYDDSCYKGYYSLAGRLWYHPEDRPLTRLIEQLRIEIQEFLLPGEVLFIDWADLAGAPVNSAFWRKT